MKKDYPSVRVRNFNIVRIDGVFGPTWAIYNRCSSEPAATAGTKEAALEVAKDLNSLQVDVKARKMGIKKRVLRAFYSVLEDESE